MTGTQGATSDWPAVRGLRGSPEGGAGASGAENSVAGSPRPDISISHLALAEDGRRRTGVQQPVREGVANPEGHAKKCKGLRDFLQGQGGRYRGRTAFALRRRATDLITKFAFAKTRRRTPVGWTPNCTVPLRETRSNGGPVEYRQVARLCGFEPRTPDHLTMRRHRISKNTLALPFPNGERNGVLRYRRVAGRAALKPRFFDFTAPATRVRTLGEPTCGGATSARRVVTDRRRRGQQDPVKDLCKAVGARLHSSGESPAGQAVRVRGSAHLIFFCNQQERTRNMFGLFKKKKKSEDGFRFKELPEVRDCLKDMTGEAMNVYVGTLVGHLLNFGKTSEDVEKARASMLAHLQKYVQAEILLDAQEHGRDPKLAELAGLRPN